MNEWEWQLLEEKTPVDHLEIAGVEVRTGSRVRLLPRKGGDVMDIALAGQIADAVLAGMPSGPGSSPGREAR